MQSNVKGFGIKREGISLLIETESLVVFTSVPQFFIPPIVFRELYIENGYILSTPIPSLGSGSTTTSVLSLSLGDDTQKTRSDREQVNDKKHSRTSRH